MIDLPPCTDEYAAHYQVPRVLVEAVYREEAGWPGAFVGPDKDGNYTLGIMQVNTRWFTERLSVDLTKHGLTPDVIQHDNCANIGMTIWLLREHYVKTGDWGKSVSIYHAGLTSWESGIPFTQKVYQRIANQ